MDRSEGKKPKGRESDLFCAQDEGKPRVAQRRSMTRRSARIDAQGRQTPERMGRARGSQRLNRVCPESEELSTRPCAQPAA